MSGLFLWPMVTARRGPGRAGDITDTANLITGLATANLPSDEDAALEWATALPQVRCHAGPGLGPVS